MLDIVPSSFKRSTIVPVPKKPRPSDLIDYRLVVMKCFEKLVRDFITSSLPASMDPLQFAYRHNRSTDDAIAHLLHTTLTHLDKGRGNNVKILFVDYSSAFNTIIPSLLTTKLEDLGLHTSLCDWIFNFQTDRPQSVRVGNCTSSTLTLSTGAPQGCVLSPLLYSLYTYDCTATSSSTIIVKFADNTVVMGLISDNDERAYPEEIKHLENWCQENNLLLNVSKTGADRGLQQEDQDRETEEELLPTGHSGKLINCGDHHHHLTEAETGNEQHQRSLGGENRVQERPREQVNGENQKAKPADMFRHAEAENSPREVTGDEASCKSCSLENARAGS
ncbi:hypothetical protein P4O66_001989 [Electrophorus voltai]|uniref:Reverse transcriptase domain-containing protein n=1 Tax=Electrophorus voltai TaxID=2609070 RepID=A0AAD9E3F4_9TELE|nr:hypothetical protein P4O66_001989 [Electrophorus voltai]